MSFPSFWFANITFLGCPTLFFRWTQPSISPFNRQPSSTVCFLFNCFFTAPLSVDLIDVFGKISDFRPVLPILSIFGFLSLLRNGNFDCPMCRCSPNLAFCILCLFWAVLVPPSLQRNPPTSPQPWWMLVFSRFQKLVLFVIWNSFLPLESAGFPMIQDFFTRNHLPILPSIYDFNVIFLREFVFLTVLMSKPPPAIAYLGLGVLK